MFDPSARCADCGKRGPKCQCDETASRRYSPREYVDMALACGSTLDLSGATQAQLNALVREYLVYSAATALTTMPPAPPAFPKRRTEYTTAEREALDLLALLDTAILRHSSVAARHAYPSDATGALEGLNADLEAVLLRFTALETDEVD